MAKTERVRYTAEQDRLIKSLGNKSWSGYEVAYQLFKDFGVVRSIEAVGARRTRLIATGEITKRGVGKHFVTQSALDWYNKQFGVDVGAGNLLELAEVKQTSRQKSNGGLSSRELIGFTKEKGPHEPQPTWTVLLMRLQRLNPDALGLFKDILKSGVAEERTAEDMIEELEQALQ